MKEQNLGPIIEAAADQVKGKHGGVITLVTLGLAALTVGVGYIIKTALPYVSADNQGADVKIDDDTYVIEEQVGEEYIESDGSDNDEPDGI